MHAKTGCLLVIRSLHPIIENPDTFLMGCQKQRSTGGSHR